MDIFSAIARVDERLDYLRGLVVSMRGHRFGRTEVVGRAQETRYISTVSCRSADAKGRGRNESTPESIASRRLLS